MQRCILVTVVDDVHHLFTVTTRYDDDIIKTFPQNQKELQIVQYIKFEFEFGFKLVKIIMRLLRLWQINKPKLA